MVSGLRSFDTAVYSRFWKPLLYEEDMVERIGERGWGNEGTASRYSGMLVFAAGFVPTKGEK